MSDIDLLVVNHNTKGKLQRLLDTLSRGWDGFELFVADNGSTDGSRDLLKTLPRDQVWFNGNIGYARAINEMALRSSSRYLMALNADTWLDGDDVESLVSFMDDTPCAAVCGPKQVDEQSRITHAGITGSYEKPKLRGWRKRDARDELYKEIEPCVSVSGSAYTMRRSVWDELAACPVYRQFHSIHLGAPPAGAWPAFNHFYEETLYSSHLHGHPELGKVYYNGEVTIGHSWHASSKVGSKWTQDGRREGQRMFRAFCDMHGLPHD